MKQLDKENLYNILFIDNHLLVVNKSADFLTQGEEGTINLQDILKNDLKKKFQKKSVFLHALYRLDKPVSGILVFLRSQKALSRMNEDMRNKKINKKYLAVCENIFLEKEKVLENFLIHGSFKAKIVQKESANAKKAILKYKVLKEKNNLSLIEIDLITGRYHQIRAQLSNISHPVLGDKKYGSKKDFKKIALECVEISLIHPTL